MMAAQLTQQTFEGLLCARVWGALSSFSSVANRPRSVLFGMNAGRERHRWPGWRVDKVGKSAETHQGPVHRPGEAS